MSNPTLESIQKAMDSGAEMTLQLKDPYQSAVVASLVTLGGYLAVIAFELNKISNQLSGESK